MIITGAVIDQEELSLSPSHLKPSSNPFRVRQRSLHHECHKATLPLSDLAASKEIANFLSTLALKA